MRLDAEWMVRADERILEFLLEAGPHSPTGIENDGRVRFGSEYIGRRLRDYLVPVGLADTVGNGVYVITDQGRSFLEGDLDARDLPDPRNL